MFSNTPFGFSNNCGPMGCAPSNCSPFNGFGGYNNCSPISGWNSGSFGGFGGYNSPSFESNYNGFGGYAFPGYNFNNAYNSNSPFSANCNTPFGGYNNWNSAPFSGYNNWNGAGFGGQGYNNWNSAPYSGHNNWSHLGHGGVNHPLSCDAPYSGMSQGMGFPGMNWNNAWMGSSAPWMSSSSYFPGNYSNQFSSQHAGYSPVSGVSNWFSSPWMGYAYPGFTQQHGVVSNGKANSPMNGQYIPNGAFPFSCAPFNVPFSANGHVPAGQGVNCEAA